MATTIATAANVLNGDAPRAYRGRDLAYIKQAIISLKTKPTFHRKERAWKILGYTSSVIGGKPGNADEFHQQIQGLWDFLVRDRTKSGHRVRGMILDALNTLDYKLRGVTTDRKLLRFHDEPNRAAIYTNTPAPIRYDGHLIEADMDEYQEDPVVPAIPLDMKMANVEYLSAQWQRYHRYQGFCAVEEQPDAAGTLQSTSRPLRAIPVPEGPDSLWHAVSYWRGGRRRLPGQARAIEGNPDIFRHWTVKGRIWTYFMQTIRTTRHLATNAGPQRYRDYWRLQQRSTIEDHEYGELSLIRSLHASPAQGRPAYPVWWDGEPARGLHDDMLWVIADYFATQIIVFYPNPIFYNPQVADNAQNIAASADRIYERAHYRRQVRATPAGLNPQLRPDWQRANSSREHYQEDYVGRMNPAATPASTPYFRRVYGEVRPNDRQILLVTSDWCHFDAADYDNILHTKKCYGPLVPQRVFPVTPTPAVDAIPIVTNQRNTDEPYGPSDELSIPQFQVPQADIRYIPTPWWTNYAALAATNPLKPPLYPEGGPTILATTPACRRTRFNILADVNFTGAAAGIGHNVALPGVVQVTTHDQGQIRGPTAPNRPEIVFDRAGVMAERFEHSLDIPGWSFQRPTDVQINGWTGWEHDIALPHNTTYGLHLTHPANHANYYQLRFGKELAGLTEPVYHGFGEPLSKYLPKHFGDV